MFTKLDSSGEARLSNSTLTFTSNGPEKHTMRSRLSASSPKTHLKQKNNTRRTGRGYLCELDVGWPRAAPHAHPGEFSSRNKSLDLNKCQNAIRSAYQINIDGPGEGVCEDSISTETSGKLPDFRFRFSCQIHNFQSERVMYTLGINTSLKVLKVKFYVCVIKNYFIFAPRHITYVKSYRLWN